MDSPNGKNGEHTQLKADGTIDLRFFDRDETEKLRAEVFMVSWLRAMINDQRMHETPEEERTRREQVLSRGNGRKK